jgi:5-methylcytosine-specific restriction endonuclease McrA
MRETRYKIYIQNWKNGLENGTRGITGTHELVRKYIFEKYNNKCSSCGWSEINPFTKKIPLEVNHIDGKYNNNQESNLELICPNCHSLTKTYRSGNRGNGRPYIRGRIK